MDAQAGLFDKPTARSTDPQASHIAAARAKLNATEGRLLALRALRDRGPLTDFELAAATGWQQTSIGKRRGECCTVGLVKKLNDAGGNVVFRPSPSKSPATVWEITEAGREFLAVMEA